MPADTPLNSVPEAEQLDGSSSSEADDKDFNSEATESACSESGGSGGDSDTADVEAGGDAEQAAPAPPAQAAVCADEHAGIWDLEEIEDINTAVLDVADLEEASEEEGDDGDGDGEDDGGGESDEEGAGPTPARAANAQPRGAPQRQVEANAALPCSANAPPASEQTGAMPPTAAADSATPSAAAAERATSVADALSTGIDRDAARESFGEQGGDEPIWSRTRARQPLEHVTLEELEALLGEVNDDRLWPALVDEDAAYQQFLDAVREGGGANTGAEEADEDDDDDDFEFELDLSEVMAPEPPPPPPLTRARRARHRARRQRAPMRLLTGQSMRLPLLKPAGDSAVEGLVAPAAARAAACGDDQALVERIQAGVGMRMPLVAQPLLPPPCSQAVGWLPEQREQLASQLCRHAQLLLAGLAAVTAAGCAPSCGDVPGAALAEQPQRPEQAAGHGVGGEPGGDPEEAAAVLLRLCASEPGAEAQSSAEQRARQVAILAAGVVAQAAGQQAAEASAAAAADAERRRAAGRDGRARTANAMHRMLVALQARARWLQAHGTAAVADCPVIQLVPPILLDIWTVGLGGAGEANGAAQENHLTEQPEHLDWDGVHGEALRMALRRLPGVFDAALLPMGGMELRQTGHKVAHLLFTPGEDRLLTRALLRFGTDTKRAHLYFMPARSEAEIEQRTASRAHNRAPSNIVKTAHQRVAGPLTDDEVQVVGEALRWMSKKKTWTFICMHLLPYRQPQPASARWRAHEKAHGRQPDNVHWTLLKAGTAPQRPTGANEAAAPMPAQPQPPPVSTTAPEPWGAPAPDCPYVGQYVRAVAEAPSDTPRWAHVQPLQPMETGSPPEEAGRLFSQLLFPSAADPLAQAGDALAAPLPVQDKPAWPAPGSGGPQPVRNTGQAPLQMQALAMAAAAVSQAVGGAAAQAEPAPPAAEQAGAPASGSGFASRACVRDLVQGLPDAAAAEHGATREPVSPMQRLVLHPRRRTRALRGRSRQGAEPAARAAGTQASALQPGAAGGVTGRPGTSGAAAADAEHAGTASGMAALRGAGGEAAAASLLGGFGDAGDLYGQRTPGGHAAGAEADLLAEGPGQHSRPLHMNSAADGGCLPGAHAASPQPCITPDEWGVAGAPSPELTPASARGLGNQGRAGASPASAARSASPSRPAEVAAAGSPAPAGPSDPPHSVHFPYPRRPAGGASAGAVEPASSSHRVPELAGPAAQAQTQSCGRAEEGASVGSCGAAQRSPCFRPASSVSAAFKRIALPESSFDKDGPDFDAAPAGAAAGVGSTPHCRPAAHSTAIDFQRMAPPNLSDSDGKDVGKEARSSAELPAEPGCEGPHQGVMSSAPIAFNRVALPDSSDSEGERGTRPAQTGDPGFARALERAQLQDPSNARQELQSSTGGHAGSRAAEGPARGGAAAAPGASSSPVMPYGHSAGAASDAAAARVWQQVAFKRVRMAESSDESETGGEGSHGGSKRVRRSPSEGCAHLGPAEGSAGQAAESGLAPARQAAPGDSSAVACSGAPAAASCVRGPGGVAAPTVVARNDTELYVDGKLTRWTKEDDRAILSAVIVRAGGQPSDAVFKRLAAEMAAAGRAAERGGAHAPAHIAARFSWLARRLGL